MNNTCSGCPAVWTGVNIAHCSAEGCHETFSTVANFDRHRRDGVCVDPRSIPTLEIRGIVWRTVISDADRDRLAALGVRPQTAANVDSASDCQLDPSDAPGATEAGVARPLDETAVTT